MAAADRNDFRSFAYFGYFGFWFEAGASGGCA
jgi:hypothetical protein